MLCIYHHIISEQDRVLRLAMRLVVNQSLSHALESLRIASVIPAVSCSVTAVQT